VHSWRRLDGEEAEDHSFDRPVEHLGDYQTLSRFFSLDLLGSNARSARIREIDDSELLGVASGD